MNLLAEGFAEVGSFFEWAFDSDEDEPSDDESEESEQYWVEALQIAAGAKPEDAEGLALQGGTGVASVR